MKFLVSSCYLAAIALVSSQSISDYLIFDPPDALSLVDYQDKPAVFQVKVKPGILKDYQKLQVTYRGENVNFDKCSLEFDASNFDNFQPVTISGAAIFNMEAPGSRSFDLEFQVFCSDGSCQYRGRGYRIDRTFSSSAMCKIWGDPHIVDFDGRNFDYQGKGYFLLTKTPRLVVHGIFDPFDNGQYSITREVSFNYMGTAYSVFFLSDTGKLILNRISYNDQHPVNPVLDNADKPRSIIFNLPDGSQITTYMNEQGTQFVEIKLPSYYKGKTEGICGKYDGHSPYANGDECRVNEVDYLAKKEYGWPVLPPVYYASQTCPVLYYPEIPAPVTTTTVSQEPTIVPIPVPYQFETVKGTTTDIPTDYVTVQIENVPEYVENKPAEKYVNPEPVPTISQADAEARCNQVLEVPGCPSLTDRKPYIEACITDILASGSLETAEASRIAYMSTCKAAAKSYEQLGNEKTKSACKSIQKVFGFGTRACPSNCNGHGTCSPAGCVCTDGYSGYDCSIAPAKAEVTSTNVQPKENINAPVESTAAPAVAPVTPAAAPVVAPAPTQTQRSNTRRTRFDRRALWMWLLNRYPQLAPYLTRFMRL